MIVACLYSLFKHTLNKSCFRFTGIDLYSGWNVWICVGFVTYTLMWACDTFIQDTEQALSARAYAHQIRYKWRKKNTIVEYSSPGHKRTFWSTYDRKICDRRNTQENNMICIACFYKLHRYELRYIPTMKKMLPFFSSSTITVDYVDIEMYLNYNQSKQCLFDIEHIIVQNVMLE